MAPAKFEIYVDQNARQSADTGDQLRARRSVEQAIASKRPELSKDDKQLFVDLRKLFPLEGGEFSIEEIRLASWRKKQRQLADRRRMDDLMRENEELRSRIDTLSQQVALLINSQKQSLNQQPSQPTTVKAMLGPPSPTLTNRLSIVPQSLQPTQGMENYNDMSMYGAMNDAPSVVHDCWKNTIACDKFTLPIDQSQYIRDNVPTSTPASKRSGGGNNEQDDKRVGFNNRRFSRPSMGGSPTLKLSPITETSRDCNSKSSSSSSTSATPSTARKALPLVEAKYIDEPDKPLDPNDTSTYRALLRALPEPLDRRTGFYRIKQNLPLIKQGSCVQAGADDYLVDRQLSNEAKMFTAQLLVDDSNDSADIRIKTVCLRVDQPANEWLFYICNELHRRLIRQKSIPDIELSIMMANPAVIYNDGSVLIDEYSRFVSLQHLLDACIYMNRPFPKSMAAYITLELIQLVKQMHTCDVVHMNICPKNILITCCPGREDIAKVDERTSVVKLIGFDRAMDMRLLPSDFKFVNKLNDLATCEMAESRPWTFEVDWFGALSCIHKMFFLDEMTLTKSESKWTVDAEFNSLPTQVWSYLYEELLNIKDPSTTSSVIYRALDELSTWVKANINFVLKEADGLDRLYEEYCSAADKSRLTYV